MTTQITELVDKFARNIDDYKNPKYNETSVRVEFVNPFWEALGWDVHNTKGYSQTYRDVIHEDEVRVGQSTKAPDYSFRIGGRRVFFLETKKPAIDLKHDPAPAYQLRRYAYSAKLPVSLLTDFEEFIVYDTTIKPSITDKSHVGRMLYFTFNEYIENWDYIQSIFSMEAIKRGDFDRFIKDKQGKKPRAEIDRDFLNDLDNWRVLLARNIALRNPRLSGRELNYAVQLTIDRLIFLRMSEDRGIEAPQTLQTLLNGERIYKRLVEIYYRADERYNSGLFHFNEKDGANPDTITPGLSIDDKSLKEIIKALYYPDCPYEFSVLPVEVLGNAYEQFLGKRISLTAGHHARIEEKPEVRKAGGVYYTPRYIVDYIVQNTVGKLLEGKTPEQVGKLRILDPACGSGSFLLGAYQYLMDWHLDTYRKAIEAGQPIPQVSTSPGKGKRKKNTLQAIFQGSGGDWYLSTTEKKRILLNNLYGVDIDANAVEVTKLSLLLKVLENENSETLSRQLGLWHERALPNLGNNIKCGNSLIGPDYYDDHQVNLFDEEETLRINVFDWQQEFKTIFANGGFDAVIGNPPYIRIQTMKEWAPKEVEFYKKKYQSAKSGNYDIYVVFVEKALTLVNNYGHVGFILPHKFFNSKYGESLRTIISTGKNLAKVVHFGDQQVFIGATTYTCLMFLNKSGTESCEFIKVDDLGAWRLKKEATVGEIPKGKITNSEWNFVVGKGSSIFERLDQMPTKLGDVTDIFVGLQTSADNVFILDLILETENTLRLSSKSLNTEWTFEKDLFFPIISGTDVNRYSELPERQYILFPYSVGNTNVNLIEWNIILQKYPNTARYLLENKKQLEEREKGKVKGMKWYGYIYLKNMARQSLIKLCIPRLVEMLYSTYDFDGSHFLDNVDVGGITIKPEYLQNSYTYLLGLLNSRLLRWYFPFVSAPFRGGWRSANRQFLSQLPTRTIDFDDPSDKSRHDRMVTLVEQMLKIHKQLAETREPRSREQIQRRINATDAQIDRLVYELYDLTPAEIAIVEGKS